MTDTFIETPAEPATSKSQIVAAVILGLAATLTALAAYKAALTDGEALQGYTDSTRTLSDANGFYAEAGQTYNQDQQLFVQFVSARFGGNTDLADYLRTLMRPELDDAITWWDETDEAVTPFDDLEGNPYTLESQTEAENLETLAGEQFQTASDADNQGDKFELAAVMLALTLFFGGVATLFSKGSVTIALLAAASALLVAGAVQLAVAL